MKHKLFKRICAMLLVFCLFMNMPGGALAETIAEMEAKQAELEQKNEELEAQLAELEDDEEKKLEYQQTLQKKIDLLQEEIDDARRNIDELNDNITALTMKLDKSQEEIQDTIDQFKERIKVLFKAGDVGTLEILLTANSFSEFALRSELVKAMTTHDQQLMETIQQYIDDTEDERVECEASKKKIADLKKQLENDQDELNDLYKKNEAALAELRDAKANTQKLIEDNQAELEANDAAMQAAIEAQKQWEISNGGGNTYWGSNVDYPTGGGGVEGFNPIWPLPGVSYVSCYYGGYVGHRGMDIAGPYGTPVVAAESGVVIAANNYDSWGDSWGYYVLVYHNSTFTTRYAHLSGLTVSNGQYVNQGEIVGYEGATGNVTGPHLHFEVYENGSRVDPMWYL